MPVSIILEYTKAAPSLILPDNKPSIRKRIELALTKRVIFFLIALAFGFFCLWFGQLVVGFAIVLISSVLFYILQTLDQSFKVDINFSEEDQLTEAVMQDLYYKNED